MKKITVYDDAAVVVIEKLQGLAKRLYEDLTELRENYIIEEDSDYNSDNNFAYLSGALEEFIDSKVEVRE